MTSRIRPSDDAAFTILEVLVVLTIALLLAAGGAVRIAGEFNRLALSRAETWLDSTLMVLRGSARREGHPQTIEFDPIARRYRIAQEPWRSLPPSVSWAFEEASDRGTAPALTFMPDGSASGATIVLRIGRLTSTRRIDQLTGTIHHATR